MESDHDDRDMIDYCWRSEHSGIDLILLPRQEFWIGRISSDIRKFYPKYKM